MVSKWSPWKDRFAITDLPALFLPAKYKRFVNGFTYFLDSGHSIDLCLNLCWIFDTQIKNVTNNKNAEFQYADRIEYPWICIHFNFGMVFLLRMVFYEILMYVYIYNIGYEISYVFCYTYIILCLSYIYIYIYTLYYIYIVFYNMIFYSILYI